jgi:hypothetical protein
MQVMCIKEARREVKNTVSISSLVEVGSIYTVIGEHIHSGDVYYKLLEFGQWVAFISSCFAPLSNIDETEKENAKIRKQLLRA